MEPENLGVPGGLRGGSDQAKISFVKIEFVAKFESMWLLIQCAIMIAVLWANIYWQWTPNHVVAGLLAVGAAYAVTRWPRGSAVTAFLVAVVIFAKHQNLN
jgi:hypothetical protein